MTKAKHKPPALQPVTYDDLPDEERIELERVMKRFAEESKKVRQLFGRSDEADSSDDVPI